MKLRLIVSWLVFGLVLLVGAWFAGQIAGRAQAAAECAHANADVYQSLLEQSAEHLKEASTKSQQLFNRLAKRAEADMNTTRELRHVLAETADSRADCRFPDSVMQQLDAARARAAEAVTSGLGATLPDPGGGG